MPRVGRYRRAHRPDGDDSRVRPDRSVDHHPDRDRDDHDRARPPAAKELAESLGVNVHTMLRAYQGLRDGGQIELRRGRGAAVVGAPTAGRVSDAVARAAAEAKSAGIPIGTLLALVREKYES